MDPRPPSQVVPFLAHEVQLEAAFLGRRQHYLALLEQQLREKDDSHGSDDDPLSGGSGSGSSGQGRLWNSQWVKPAV